MQNKSQSETVSSGGAGETETVRHGGNLLLSQKTLPGAGVPALKGRPRTVGLSSNSTHSLRERPFCSGHVPGRAGPHPESVKRIQITILQGPERKFLLSRARKAGQCTPGKWRGDLEELKEMVTCVPVLQARTDWSRH